jgi:hypothetical protein
MVVLLWLWLLEIPTIVPLWSERGVSYVPIASHDHGVVSSNVIVTRVVLQADLHYGGGTQQCSFYTTHNKQQRDSVAPTPSSWTVQWCHTMIPMLVLRYWVLFVSLCGSSRASRVCHTGVRIGLNRSSSSLPSFGSFVPFNWFDRSIDPSFLPSFIHPLSS